MKPISPRLPETSGARRHLQEQARIAELEGQLQIAQRTVETNRLILHSAGEGIYGLDAEGRTTFVNPAAEAMTGWAASDIVGKMQHSILHHSHANGELYPREECPIYGAIRDSKICHRDDEVFWRKDGSSFPVRYTSTPILQNGLSVGAVVLFQDITERKRKESWDRSRTSIFLCITTHKPVKETLVSVANALVAYEPGWSVGILLRCGDCLTLAAEAGSLPVGLRAAYASLPLAEERSICARAASSGREIFLDGPPPDAVRPMSAEFEGAEDSWIELSESGVSQAHILPLGSATGGVVGVLAIFSRKGMGAGEHMQEPMCSAWDMARLAIEHEHLHTELIRRSQFDGLTGLPNGMLLMDRLKRDLIQAKLKGTKVGVCCIDLDRFKQINETLGNEEGDNVLQRVASTLSGGLREIDTVARPGEDTFVVILPDLEHPSQAEQICMRLLARLRQPFLVGGTTRVVTGSTGIAVYPADGASADLLMTHAEFAARAAKQGGRDQSKRYSPILGQRMERFAAVQEALLHALQEGQFKVFYQGLFDTKRRLIGFEALLRWFHRELGPVAPDEFIPMAEQSGLIVEIGTWVLGEACRQMVEWQKTAAGDMKIFVNISGVQLSRPDFTSVVIDALRRTGLAPTSLELEITESWVMNDPAAASLQLEALHDLGVSSAIDDFGTGHSSFSSLHKLAVDAIKIDQSFVRRLDGTAKNSATVRTIVSLARELGLATVAEGIETEEQMGELCEMDCSILQGFLLARPVDAAAAGKLIPQRMALPV